MMSSSAARVLRKPAARPGGFGCSDRTPAGLAEARGTYHIDHITNQRRIRAGLSRSPG